MRSVATFVVLLLLNAGAGVAQPAPVPIAECATDVGSDVDNDGLTDLCEARLVRLFAPILVVRGSGCNWDTDTQRLGGGYFFAVQRVNGALRVAFLPAYFRDCGWSGIKCWLPWVDCAAHDGDSEFIVVELQREATTMPLWSVSGLFLSAHCFGRHAQDCRWYRERELRDFDWSGTAPVIWVAEGRQANFPSRQRCDRGIHTIDTCDAHNMRYRYPVDDARNIGSRAQPFLPGGCITGEQLGHARAQAQTIECFWRADTPFRGWQLGAAGVTPYDRYLGEIAGF